MVRVDPVRRRRVTVVVDGQADRGALVIGRTAVGPVVVDAHRTRPVHVVVHVGNSWNSGRPASRAVAIASRLPTPAA
jgi:hypothetical protein